jgi:BirA family biotin operon repressor/biotin-[acetyl-CoA-carboxylase] ligase
VASFFKYNFLFLDDIGSTNEYAKKLLKEKKIQEGAVITSKFQKKGKGQMDVNWESEYGKNLLMSLLVSPDIPVVSQFNISMCISLALHDFASSYFPKQVKNKWPNDLLIKKEKIAGILIQNIVSNNLIRHSIIGIGLNVNQIIFAKYSLKATSFKNLLGEDYDIHKLQKELLYCVRNRYLKLKQLKFDKIRKEYTESLFALNRWMNYKVEGKKIKAKLVGIDKIGKILLEFENGRINSFSLKEVAFL